GAARRATSTRRLWPSTVKSSCVPGAIPSSLRISAGITTWPFSDTVATGIENLLHRKRNYGVVSAGRSATPQPLRGFFDHPRHDLARRLDLVDHPRRLAEPHRGVVGVAGGEG